MSPLSAYSLFSSVLGAGSGAGTYTVVSLTAMATTTMGRGLVCQLWGPLTVGASFTLTNGMGVVSSCNYTEQHGGQTSYQWVSSGGGTITIDSVTGKTFTFTVHAAAMAVNPAQAGTPATGTFTVDGTGAFTLP